MSENSWDVVVIGGGPAGCSAAISLSKRGLRVLLCEAKTYPHDKLCGEFLSPECAGMLDLLGMSERLPELGGVPIHSLKLTTADQNTWESRLPATALGLSRKTLDAALADQARRVGVTLQEAATVSGVSGNLPEGFNVEVTGSQRRTTLRTRAVVAAHGKRAALDRVLGRNFLRRKAPYIALKAHFHGPPIPGRIELHTFPGGYCGLSEIEEGKKVVCLLVSEQVFKGVCGENQGNLDGFIEWMKRQNLFLRSWLQWADRIHERWITIAQVPFALKPAMEGDIFMAGDSAGLIAPLAGNGIAMALDGGMLAADYLARHLAGEMSLKTVRKAYPAAWRRRFGLRLRLGQALQPLMLRPASASLALRLINTFPSLGQLLIERTRGPLVPAFQAAGEGGTLFDGGETLFAERRTQSK